MTGSFWVARSRILGKSKSLCHRSGLRVRLCILSGPNLGGQTVQQALPQRAEAILTGNGLASVRDTAIAPCGRQIIAQRLLGLVERA